MKPCERKFVVIVDFVNVNVFKVDDDYVSCVRRNSSKVLLLSFKVIVGGNDIVVLFGIINDDAASVLA